MGDHGDVDTSSHGTAPSTSNTEPMRSTPLMRQSSLDEQSSQPCPAAQSSTSDTNDRYRIKVRDFAYEPPLLPRIQVVPRPTPLEQFLLARRTLKRSRDVLVDGQLLSSSQEEHQDKRPRLVTSQPTEPALFLGHVREQLLRHSHNAIVAAGRTTIVTSPSRIPVPLPRIPDDAPPTPILEQSPTATHAFHHRSPAISSPFKPGRYGYRVNDVDSFGAMALQVDTSVAGGNTDHMTRLASASDLCALAPAKVGRTKSELISTPT